MKINPSILTAIGSDQDVATDALLVNPRSFCERTVMEDFLRICDIPGISPQWCIDEIQKNLQAECGNQYSCLIAENDPSTVASLHDYRGRAENYYAICGDVTNREINKSKLQSACWSAYGNCWDNENTADCMKDFLFTREDDVIYQYCPDGESNVLITQKENQVQIASQNPDGNTARENQMPYQCVAYCTGGEPLSEEPDTCGPMFPFGRDSNGARSIIEYLSSNHNYKTRITSEGTVIYKIHDVQMRHGEAQARCDQDSEDAGVPGFLHLPMPRNEAENEIYFDIISQQTSPAWLDIVEVNPLSPTSPRTWAYKDGSPVIWVNWKSGEPNNYRGGVPGKEPQVQMYSADDTGRLNGKWNDQYSANRLVVCTYFLPAGAENNCTWLHEFED